MTKDLTPPLDHPWMGDDDGHNCVVCKERDDALHLCWREAHQPTDEVSEAVAETLRQAAQYLQGRGEPPDWDALSPEDQAVADDLLPAIVELVGDRIVPVENARG